MSAASREAGAFGYGPAGDRTEASAVPSNGPAADAPPRDYSGGFETILLELDPTDRVATLTLNRPERLNAFNRTMCEEVQRAWHTIKLDDSVNAVVVRAAGDRAFSAGLDVTSDYGQPASVWHHEDPGELLSPKWQKMWKPVVCAVHGMCTAGAFYFVNESDVVVCSDEATFFDSHVSAGLVSALEPVGLMRRIGLGETLRMALMGNDERVSAQTALRIGLVSEVVAREHLWARAHSIAAGIAAKPPAATQGTVKAIWESLDKPYRAALDHGLIYTRLGNPIGKSELAASSPTATEPRIR
ncbi:enoyl-CoA hydratase/isomerase family protein [Nocardia sp. NPDC058499]|uniref:enoyl-CoA hydratase/isomerase family protein n=1 Tax=Nocardia sp. NPDC058499 TaxID=3346530 RepID=UPI00365D1C59